MKFVITGISSGLGYELANKLISFGDVIGISRRKHDLCSSQTKHSFEHITMDLSSHLGFSGVSEGLKSLKSSVGDTDFTLIFNAGVFHLGETQLNSKTEKKLFYVNLFRLWT